ncbi:MAG: DnaD domain protein [Erysipelotrichaceae bacterium]|nr:DnaD domain protein [Erysipelotrichaceae bacterium]
MLGNNLFKVENRTDLNNSQYKALVLLYGPLIGNDALYLYQFLSVKNSSLVFDELNKLLNSLMYSIDRLENCLAKLNEYKLLRTLKKGEEDVYVFILENPLSFEEFINNDIFVRDFILKTSGLYYQSLISDCKANNTYSGYDDISAKYNIESLNNWTEDNESFLKPIEKKQYKFNGFFDINVFLQDISNRLLPLKYRTEENLSEIVKLADLYSISYDKMRSFIPKVSKSGTNKFDLDLLRYLCQNTKTDFKYYDDGIYAIPCIEFLMNKQEGKEVTPVDKKIIYTLANDYNLNPDVINVVLEHSLNNCNNALIEKYIYPVASDLHRNNVTTAKMALERLDKNRTNRPIKENIETYDASINPDMSDERREELRRRRENNE